MESLALSVRLERRWPLWAALALALGWLLAAIVEVAAHGPGTITAVALAVLPPLGLAALIGALLPGAGRVVEMAGVEDRLAEAGRSVGDLQARLGEVDALLGSTAERAERLVMAASGEAQGLTASAAALEAAAAKVVAGGEETRRLADHFRDSLPEVVQTIATVDATLRSVGADSGVQLRAVETMLAAVQTRNRDAAAQADSAIANMTGLLARIDEASTRNTAALSKRAYALDAAVDGVLERTAATVDHIREQVEARLEALQTGVEASGRQMAFLGDDSIRLFNQRLEQLLRTSEQMQAHFAAQEADSVRLQAQLEAQLQALSARFGALGEAGAAVAETLHSTTTAHFSQAEARLDDLRAAGTAASADVAAQVMAIETGLAGLEAPLAASQAALHGLDAQSTALRQIVAEVETSLAERIAATRGAMQGLEDEANAMLDSVATLRDSVADGTQLVGAAAAGLAIERSEVVALATTLAGHFDAARTALATVHADTAEATTAAAAALSGEIARIEEAAGTAAAAVRVQLAAAIADSVDGLQAAADDHAAAFGAPITAQLAAIEDAAARAGNAGKAVAERLAANMVNLVETVARVDARVGEVETRFAVRERDSLAARSSRLIGQLNDSLIDVTRLLALTIKDDDWARYLKGDRSVFAHAMAPQLDREASRRMARMFEHDPAFREEAARYLDLFEMLIERLLGDRDGEAFAATMLSSDIGKIYVAIAEATDRLPPNRTVN